MKTVLGKLTHLADGLDSLGLHKDADSIDQLVAKAARNEDFGDLLSLFDAPVELDDSEEALPGARPIVIDEPEIHTPLEEEEAPLEKERERTKELSIPGYESQRFDDSDKPIGDPFMTPDKADRAARLHELVRRNEILKIKRQLEREQLEQELEQPEPEAEDKPEIRPKLVLPEETEEDFEDEENDAEDDSFDERLLIDEPGDEPYKGLSLTRKMKERPVIIEEDAVPDEDLEILRINEHKKEELKDKVNALIQFKTNEDFSWRGYDWRDLIRLKNELELEIADAADEGLIEQDYADKLLANLEDAKSVEDEDDENEADDEAGFIDKLKDILKDSPELAKKILKLVSDNPKLLELAL